MLTFLRFIVNLVMAAAAPRAALVAENVLLRQQLIVAQRRVKRPRLRRFDRWLIGTLAGAFRSLVDAVLIVKPATVIRWHRAGWRLLWRWSSSRRPAGRPPVDAELRALIRLLWRDNATWGEDRIAGELAKLGYRVSPRTVAKYRPAGLARGHGQRWMTFIRNHLHETWACDFFVIVTIGFRVLYVFVVLSLGRRRLVHYGVTEHPGAAWAAQRFVEATVDAEHAPRFLVHDRDSVYGGVFRSQAAGRSAASRAAASATGDAHHRDSDPRRTSSPLRLCAGEPGTDRAEVCRVKPGWNCCGAHGDSTRDGEAAVILPALCRSRPTPP